MEFNEIYCNRCKKILGKYNTKYYSEDKIGDLLKTNYSVHVKEGHELIIRKVKTGKN